MPYVEYYDKYLPRYSYSPTRRFVDRPARYYDYLDRPALCYEHDCYRPASQYAVYYADAPRYRYYYAKPTLVTYVDSGAVRYEEPIRYRRYFDDYARVYPARYYDVELLPGYRRPHYEHDRVGPGHAEAATPNRLVRCASDPGGGRRQHELDAVYDDVKEGRMNKTDFRKAMERTPASTSAPDGSPIPSDPETPASRALRFDDGSPSSRAAGSDRR